MRFHFIAGKTAAGKKAYKDLTQKYGQTESGSADCIIVLGGDGTMLQVMHQFMRSSVPIYGMNRGSVGFLMNEYKQNNLPDRIAQAQKEIIHPLHMQAESEKHGCVEALAINEVCLFRQSYQAAKVKILIDGKTRMEELICDGIMAATPAGSTAYNLSAQGPILPLMAPLIALTAVSPFRPRRWHGALLPDTAAIQFELLDSKKRPVNASADNHEVKSVRSVRVSLMKNIHVAILSDPGHSWNERILAEQFPPGGA